MRALVLEAGGVWAEGKPPSPMRDEDPGRDDDEHTQEVGTGALWDAVRMVRCTGYGWLQMVARAR